MNWSTLTTAEKLALATTVLGLLHHLDHVLRFDHSGWPFRDDVNTFSYSLLVYPVIALILFARGYPRLRVGLAFLLFLFPTLSHAFIETPADQFHTWAHRPGMNLLEATSPVLGGAAAVLTVSLSAAPLLTFLAFWREHRAQMSAAP